MYLFDILLLGSMAFRNGLSSILENKAILKVSTPAALVVMTITSRFGFTRRSFTTAETSLVA